MRKILMSFGIKRFMSSFLIIIIFVFSSCTDNGGSERIKELASQLQEGQTYAEVCEIFGDEGVDVGSGTILFEWSFGKEGKVLVWFTESPESHCKTPDDLIVSSVRTESVE